MKTELINAIQKAVQAVYDIMPLPQKIILTFRKETYAMTACTLTNRKTAVRTYSEADRDTATFGAAALLVSPEDYGKNFVLEIDPKGSPEGSFRFYLKDAGEDTAATYSLSIKGSEQAEEKFFCRKAIYAAAAVNYSETGSMAFAGYLVVDGKDYNRRILRYHTKSVIEKDPAKGEEFAVNMAKEALRHAGKNPEEFSVFTYSGRQHYADPEVLKELAGLYKDIKAQ